MTDTTATVPTDGGALPAAAPLNIGDIQNAIRVIDFACEQGAFKGWQVIEQVQAVRFRLLSFVESVQVPVDPTAPSAPLTNATVDVSNDLPPAAPGQAVA